MITLTCKWGLKINVKKTKICIFEKKRSRRLFNWKINIEIIETVDEFGYLGIKFHHTGNMANTVKALNDQALKAYNQLLHVFSRISEAVKTKLALYDSLVVPIILYGSEVWGIYSTPENNKIHLRFCKLILGVKQQTPNAAVFGELGRFPLAVICKQQALHYWIKIMNKQDSLMYRMFKNKDCI